MSRKIYKKMANKLEDYWRPPINFEDWQERAQNRLKRDIIEEEHRLISIEDKKLKKSQRAYEKATITHRNRIEEIKYNTQEKIKNAKEIGVFQGDINNPILGLNEALIESRKQIFDIKKREFEEPDYVHIGGKQNKQLVKGRTKRNRHKIYKK